MKLKTWKQIQVEGGQYLSRADVAIETAKAITEGTLLLCAAAAFVLFCVAVMF
jgi:hypothetical protein